MIQQLHTTCTQLKRDEITIPDQWKFEITQPPGKFEKTNISKIIERMDRKILLQLGSYIKSTSTHS